MLREVWDPFKSKKKSDVISPPLRPSVAPFSLPSPALPKSYSRKEIELWSPDDPQWTAHGDGEENSIPSPSPQPLQQHLVLPPLDSDRVRESKVSMDAGAVELKDLNPKMSMDADSGEKDLNEKPIATETPVYSDPKPQAAEASGSPNPEPVQQQAAMEAGPNPEAVQDPKPEAAGAEPVHEPKQISTDPASSDSKPSDSKPVNELAELHVEASNQEKKSSENDGLKNEMNGSSSSSDIPDKSISIYPPASQSDLSPSPVSNNPSVPLWTQEEIKPKTSRFMSNQWIIVWSIFASLVAGTLTGLYSTPGPPIMLLFAYLQFSKEEIRMTSSAHFLTIWPVKVACLIYFEILKKEHWPYYVCCAGFNLVGGGVGTALFRKVPTKKVVALLLMLIFISSAALLKIEEPSPFGITFLILYVLACGVLATWTGWIYHLQGEGKLPK